MAKWMDEPEEHWCDRCEDVRPTEGAEWDVADYPDGDESGRQRPWMICGACLNEPTIYHEPRGDGQLMD
jgi:hypothetical protein